MNDFKETLEYIEEVRNKEFIGIPFNMGPFDEVFPFIEKSRYILIFASTGVGKTQFSVRKFLIEPFLFAIKTGYKLHITYAAVEMRRVDIMAQAMSYFYYLKYGEIHAKEAWIRNKPGDSIMQKLYKLEEDYYKFNEIVDITETHKFPTGLYKYVKNKLLADGKIIKDGEFKSHFEESSGTHHLLITDTINALKIEQGQNQTTNIDRFSGDYCKELVDYYGVTCVNLQQADKQQDISEFNFKGNKIEFRTLPSKSSLAYSKHTNDHANIVMDLYSPYSYGIKQYPFDVNKNEAYDITKWENNWRRLNISKNRDGDAPAECAMYFNGKIADFQYLPKPEEFVKNPKLYEKYGIK